MIHLLYGADSYQVAQALASIRRGLAEGDDMLASNTSMLDGRATSPDELLAHATAVPFLSPNRLVIVDGLLAALGGVKRGRGKKGSPDDPVEPWRQTAARLGDPTSLPATTTLVFVEGDIRQSNIAFGIFSPIAKTTEYPPLGSGELLAWVKNAAKRKHLKLTDGAATSLARLAGADLWTIGNELDKLGAYAGGEAIGEALVQELVSASQETKFWDVSDAVIAGDERKALTALRRLLTDGEPLPVITSLIVRQYRQLMLVKDLRERRASRDETIRTSGVPAFKLDSVGSLAQRYSWAQLREAYRKLLEADLSVKRGLQDDESALQLLIHELCALRPVTPQRPAYAR